MTSLTPVPHWVPCVPLPASCSSHGGRLLAARLQGAIQKAHTPAPFMVATLLPRIIVAQGLQACVQGEQPLSNPVISTHVSAGAYAQQAGPSGCSVTLP